MPDYSGLRAMGGRVKSLSEKESKGKGKRANPYKKKSKSKKKKSKKAVIMNRNQRKQLESLGHSVKPRTSAN